MKAVILVAGRGTRMGDLCDDTPKPLLPINGRPKLAYTVETLPHIIDEVIFVVGYLGEQIRTFFGDSYNGIKISYVEQIELNGTGGAVMLTKDLVGEEKFLVLMGDDFYLKEDLEKMLVHDFSLLAYETDEADQFGLVDVNDEEYLEDVVERPHVRNEGLVNTAAYVLSASYFDMDLIAISDTEYGLPQTLVAARKEHPIKVITTKMWFPIGNPEALEEAQKEIMNYI